VLADYMAPQYWSEEFTWLDSAILVPMADAEIQVTGSGLPLAGVNVYVFTASGAYLGLTDTTDESGNVTFRLAGGNYKFRADYQSSQYWSSEETLIAGQVNPVSISTGGGVFSFTVIKGANDHLTGVNCYVFNEAGAYLGMTEVTSSEGQVTFNLANGSYKFRVDYMGYQFWSPVYTVPDTLSASLTIAHQDVTINVEGNYQGTEPIEGVPVYLFTTAGTYMNQNQTTNSVGQVVFSLPEHPYKVRVDYLGQQFWSGESTWQNTSVTINKGMAEIHVTRSGSDVVGAKVYLFSEQGAYLGWYETTDSTGNAEFLLPDRAFKFRADEGDDQQWSPLIDITAGVINNVEIDIAPVTVDITADPDSIEAGASSTLSWSSVGADTCVIEPDIGTVDVNGSISVSPTATTVYTITATGPGGTAADSVQVMVIAAAALEDVDYGLDYNEQQGGGGLVGETIRILNGNAIEFRSDLNFPSPNQLGLSFVAAYNSRSDSLGSLLGFGWTHTYSAFLDSEVEDLVGSYISVTDETGRVHYFLETAAGVFEGFSNERSVVRLEAGEYVWYRLEGSRYGFSADGKLAWIEDQKANRLTLGYDAQGKLETVIDTTSGRTLTFYYVNGLLDHITGPATDAVSDGIWVSYGYDGSQNLTSVTYADGSGYSYSYSDPNEDHNITEKRNAANHLLGTWSYDSQDRCTTHTNPDGTDVTVAYVSPGQVDVTDAYSTLRSYSIEEISGRSRVTAMTGTADAPYSDNSINRWAYDTQLNLIEIESVGGTIYQYQDFDSRGNPGTVILAAGAAEQRAVTFTYHPDMNVILQRTEQSVLGAGDKVTIWDYDDDYDTTANENPTNLLARIIEQGFTNDATGATVAYEYITTFTNNTKGQVESIDGPLAGIADTTQFGYDTATGNLLSITRPLVGSTGFANYDAAGQVGRVTDVNSQSESFTYDGRGRVTGVTHEADVSIRSVSYNTAGLPDTATDEDGVAKTYEYDTNGRLYRQYDGDGNYLEHLYDAQGNLIERSKHDPSGVRTARKRWTYQHPNLPGKLYKEIKADDGYSEYGYDTDGNVNAVTDFNGNTTTYGYDALSRVITVAQPGGILTSYDYDQHGNLASVLDAENYETTYTYDDLGRVVATTSTDSGTTAYVYNAAGNPIQKTNAKGITVQYDYDDLRRLTAVRFPDAAQNITYTYDAGSFGVGRLTGMTDPAGTADFEYDSRGRLVGKGSTIAGYSYSVTRGFTPGGRLDSFIYPSSRTIDYTRYASSRIQTVATTYNSTTINLVNNLSYNPFGDAKGLGTGSGGTVNNTTNESGDLAVINPGEQMEQVYTYDGNRNLLSIRGTNTPWYNQDFDYDDLNRLLSADGIFGTIDVTYDDVGNRLTRTVDSQVDTYTYQPGTGRLAQITGANPAVFSYDANGNITDIDSRIYVYNQNNRLVRVEEGLDILGEYTYNGSGQRQMKEVVGVATVFHYDFDGNIIAESQADGTMTAEYLYVDQSRMAMVTVGTGALYFFHNNYLGTPVLMTDTTGTVVWEADYKPFGEARVNPNSGVVNNFRFAGQYYDEETGLHYNYHRYYDPKIGRYLTPDPIGLEGGINLYAYVFNNPINKIDPLGLQQYNAANAYRLLHQGYSTPQVNIQWSDYRRGISQWLQSLWADTEDACEETIDHFDPFFDATGRIFFGIGQAGEGTWDALVYNEELHGGVVFGFSAAGEVTYDVFTDYVIWDVFYARAGVGVPMALERTVTAIRGYRSFQGGMENSTIDLTNRILNIRNNINRR